MNSSPQKYSQEFLIKLSYLSYRQAVSMLATCNSSHSELANVLLKSHNIRTGLEFDNIFRAMLDSNEPCARITALKMFSENRDIQIIRKIATIITDDPDRDVRYQAVQSIWFAVTLSGVSQLPKYTDEALFCALKYAASSDTDECIRRKALETFALYSTQCARLLISKSLVTNIPGDIASGIVAAANGGFKNFLPAIVAFSNDVSPEVRCAVAFALGQICNSQQIHLLLPLLDDENLKVQLQCIESISNINSENSVVILLKLAKSQQIEIAKAAQEKINSMREFYDLGSITEAESPSDIYGFEFDIPTSDTDNTDYYTREPASWELSQ